MAIVKSHKIDFKKKINTREEEGYWILREKINQEIMTIIIICTLQRIPKDPTAVMKLVPAEQHSCIIYSDKAESSVIY